MTEKKLCLAAVLTALVLNSSGANACTIKPRASESASEQSKNKTQTPTPAPPLEGENKLETKNSGEVKELAAGGYGSVKEPFIIVARDTETYASLRRLNEQLPELKADFFKSNAVIAAFLGQRRSGGYSVRITRGSGEQQHLLRISEQTPPKDAMTTMALTAPFQIVSVAVADERPLGLELDAAWQEAARPYKVDTGEFTRMGGFAGRMEKSKLAGNLRVMRHAQLATLFFALQGTGEEGTRALQDVATGTISSDGNFTLTRLDPGSFVPPPRHPLRVQGKFGASENMLMLKLEVMQLKVSDGYGGQGTLSATATAPAPKKRAVDDDDPM
jgi:hypothetical protein